MGVFLLGKTKTLKKIFFCDIFYNFEAVKE